MEYELLDDQQHEDLQTAMALGLLNRSVLRVESAVVGLEPLDMSADMLAKRRLPPATGYHRQADSTALDPLLAPAESCWITEVFAVAAKRCFCGRRVRLLGCW